MSPLRLRMIEDMNLAGLAAATQSLYLRAVYRLAAHYRRSPQELSEEEVRCYLVSLRDQGAARGTFKTSHYGIQFFYRHTLDRDWALFSKKRFASRSKGAYPRRWPMLRCVACCPA